MPFDYVLPWITGKKEEKDAKLARIQKLKEQLVIIGYRPSEVDYMIMMTSENKSTRKLNDADIKRIELMLEDQLSLGKKCLDFVKDNKANKSS